MINIHRFSINKYKNFINQTKTKSDKDLFLIKYIKNYEKFKHEKFSIKYFDIYIAIKFVIKK